MRSLTPTWKTGLLVGAALVAPVALAVAMMPLRSSMGATNVALVLVVLVVAMAAFGRRGIAVTAAVAAAISFDVFHVEPYGSLAIAHPIEMATVALVLVAGLAVAQVATWGRRQRTTAERTISDVSILRSVAEIAADGEDPDHLVFTAAFWLRELVDLDDCRLELGADPSAPASLSPEGEITIGPLRWDPERGLPAEEIALAVRSGGRILGHFVLTPKPGMPVHPDRLFTAVALADLVGLALGGRNGQLSPG